MLKEKMAAMLLTLSLGSSLLANNDFTNQTKAPMTLGDAFFETDIAVTDAILLDGTIMTALYLAGAIPSFMAVPTAVAIAAGGYAVRKACKHYFYEGQSSVLCGFLGGSLKYGTRAILGGKTDMALFGLTILRGGINAGLYEFKNKDLNEAYDEKKYGAFYGHLVGIEVLDGVLETLVDLKTGTASTESLIRNVKGGAFAGLTLGASIDSFYTYYAKSVREAYAYTLAYLSGDHKNQKQEL